MGVTYDTGALIAGERNDRSMWLLHKSLLTEGAMLTVPAGVLAEAWRGGARQASLARMLAGCHIEPLDDDAARSTGVLAGAADHDDAIDVSVVEIAHRLGDTAIVTSNRDHIVKVVAALPGFSPTVHSI
ncbi:MAG TPA: hypothetical protein VNQ73_24195 [Ilumatobacter sp.]|nr:hypothetical protein [Ilumatobacter sp.]